MIYLLMLRRLFLDMKQKKKNIKIQLLDIKKSLMIR